MNFDNQNIELENQEFKVTIGYTNHDDGTLEINSESLLDDNKHQITFESGEGFWLTKRTEKDDAQSVKLLSDKLIIALYQDLVCFKIPELTIEWHLELDEMPIYEFLDIEDDILLRGELQIFRINMNGEIIWSTYGEDIWVNIEGKPEMQIVNDHLILTDFNGQEYRFKVSETREMPNIKERREQNLNEPKIKKRKRQNWFEKLFEKKKPNA